MSSKYMVDTQIKPRGVTDPRVLNAMEKVDRHLFVPEEYQKFAYSDCPLPLSQGQTISQPFMVAAMTEYLKLDKDSIVLEIGTGSGYQTAILAELVKEVYTIEIVEPLARHARQLLARLEYNNIHFRFGNGHFGWKEHAPYDAIIVTAAPEEVPQALVEQLKPGGNMVIPVGPTTACQELYLIVRDLDGTVTHKGLMSVRFVPLTGERC